MLHPYADKEKSHVEIPKNGVIFLNNELPKINFYRKKIDEIDLKIVKLLNRRAQYADQIGSIKQRLNMPVYTPIREEQVINNVQQKNPGPLSAEAIRRVYERIIDESRRLEKENNEHKQNE